LGKKVRRVMVTRKEMQKAQRILDETIETLKGNIKCEVFGYDKKGYKVRFFKRAGTSTGGMKVNIPKEWIEDTSPIDNNIREELEGFLRELEQKPKKKRR
jgi:NADH:ubiquinone oxidoreductase subunit D